MDEENCIKLYGYPKEFEYWDEDTIVIEGNVYTDQSLESLIKDLEVLYEKPEPYDAVLSQGRGMENHSFEERLSNTVVINLISIRGLQKIYPRNQFEIDYPKIILEKYVEFMDALNFYFDTFRYER